MVTVIITIIIVTMRFLSSKSQGIKIKKQYLGAITSKKLWGLFLIYSEQK